MSEKPYVVRVWDNFHYMDEDEAYNHGSFETFGEALAAAQLIVDQSLEACVPLVKTVEELIERYVIFGDDPVILGPPGTPDFMAWDYAKLRSEAIFGGPSNFVEPRGSPEPK